MSVKKLVTQPIVKIYIEVAVPLREYGEIFDEMMDRLNTCTGDANVVKIDVLHSTMATVVGDMAKRAREGGIL